MDMKEKMKKNPDPYPDWAKMIDPDPDQNRSGSIILRRTQFITKKIKKLN
jgi:hypothetical protein